MTTVRWREECTSTRMMFSFATKTFSCCQENRRRYACSELCSIVNPEIFHRQNISDLDTHIVSCLELISAAFFLPLTLPCLCSFLFFSPFYPVPSPPSPPFPSYLYPPLKLQPPRITWWPGLQCTSWCLQNKEMALQITHHQEALYKTLRYT